MPSSLLFSLSGRALPGSVILPALIPLLVVIFGRHGDLQRNGRLENEQIVSWKNPADEYETPVFAVRPRKENT
jgi:hypothetical protein